MINQQLLDYIKEQLSGGQSRDEIRKNLLINGWQKSDIDEAFSLFTNPGRSPEQVVASLPESIPSTLLGVTAIIGGAWRVYKEKFLLLIGIIIVPALIQILASAFKESAMSGSAFPSIASIAVLLPLLILLIVSQTWGELALFYAVTASEPIGIGEAYRRSFHKILSFWWLLILMGFIVTGGSVFLIIPGVVFAIWFSLAMFILVVEDIRGMNALLKSKEYVRGYWGGVLWRLLFVVIISLIAGIVFGFILYLLRIPYSAQISSFFLSLFVGPFAMTYFFLVYQNLKAVKGDFVFTPKRKQKAVFVAVGVFGFLIIPILSGLILFNLNSSRVEARNLMRQTHLKLIQSYVELYFYERGEYPRDLSDVDFNSKTPADPKTGEPYEYKLKPDGSGYVICGILEQKGQKCLSDTETSF